MTNENKNDSSSKYEELIGRADPKKKQTVDVEEKTHRMVIFRIGESTFAVGADAVREIIQPEKVSRVPFAAPFVRGVFNLRGMICSLIEIDSFLGIDRPDQTGAAEDGKSKLYQIDFRRILMIETASFNTGVVVDEVIDVRSFEQSLFGPFSGGKKKGSGRFAERELKLASGPALVLDAEKLFEHIQTKIRDYD